MLVQLRVQAGLGLAVLDHRLDDERGAGEGAEVRGDAHLRRRVALLRSRQPLAGTRGGCLGARPQHDLAVRGGHGGQPACDRAASGDAQLLLHPIDAPPLS